MKTLFSTLFVRISLGTLALSAASLVFACSGTDDDVSIGQDNQPLSCLADSDCPAGETCANGFCSGPVNCQPTAEVCDGIDSDCDGVVDNGATCAFGETCVAGVCQGPNGCDPANAPPETCDGVDNDCDGAVDEGNLCAANEQCQSGVCQPCNNGGCASPCAADSDCPPGLVCNSGVCGPSNNCQPSPEVCDGVDNDCDGVVDNSATCPPGESCMNGSCQGGCDPANAMPEVCDGVDNDCNGVVDEGALCGFAMVCLSGTCQPCAGANCPTPCASDSDCAPIQTCQNGYCL